MRSKRQFKYAGTRRSPGGTGRVPHAGGRADDDLAPAVDGPGGDRRHLPAPVRVVQGKHCDWSSGRRADGPGQADARVRRILVHGRRRRGPGRGPGHAARHQGHQRAVAEHDGRSRGSGSRRWSSAAVPLAGLHLSYESLLGEPRDGRAGEEVDGGAEERPAGHHLHEGTGRAAALRRGAAVQGHREQPVRARA